MSNEALIWLGIFVAVIILPFALERLARIIGRGFSRGKADTFKEIMEHDDENEKREEDL